MSEVNPNPGGTGAPAAGAPATPAAAPTTPAVSNDTKAPATDFRTTIPETYREKNYLRDVKSADDVFKMLDNAQTMIGKQGKTRPADDAPPEAWDQYYSTSGRPESADKYDFKRADGVAVDEAVDKQVKEMLFKHGIGAREAVGIVSEYEAMVEKLTQEQNLKVNEQFTAMGKELFGDKLDVKLKEGQELLAGLLPEAAKKFLGQIDNNSMIVLAAIMDQVRTKYVGEDKTKLSGDGGSQNSGETQESLQAKARELMASKEYQDPMHMNHEKLKKDVADIYGRIAAMKKGRTA